MKFFLSSLEQKIFFWSLFFRLFFQAGHISFHSSKLILLKWNSLFAYSYMNSIAKRSGLLVITLACSTCITESSDSNVEHTSEYIAAFLPKTCALGSIYIPLYISLWILSYIVKLLLKLFIVLTIKPSAPLIKPL